MAGAVRDAVASLGAADTFVAAAAACERLKQFSIEGHAALLLANGAVPALVAAAQRPVAAFPALTALQRLGQQELAGGGADDAAVTDALVSAGAITTCIRVVGQADALAAAAASITLCNFCYLSPSAASPARAAARAARQEAMLANGAVAALTASVLRQPPPILHGVAGTLCNLFCHHPDAVSVEPRAIDALAAILLHPPDAAVAKAAANAFVALAEGDDDPRLGARLEAVSANPGALAALVAATERRGEPEVAGMAVKALAWCGHRVGEMAAPAWGAAPAAMGADDARMDRLVAAGVHVPLLKALAHPDPGTARLAASALRFIGADAAALENPRADAIFAAPGAVAALQAALRRKETQVAGAAAIAFAILAHGTDAVGGPARRAALAANGGLALILAVAQNCDGDVATSMAYGLQTLLSSYFGDGGCMERRELAVGLGAVKIMVAAAARRDGGAMLIEMARAACCLLSTPPLPSRPLRDCVAHGLSCVPPSLPRTLPSKQTEPPVAAVPG